MLIQSGADVKKDLTLKKKVPFKKEKKGKEGKEKKESAMEIERTQVVASPEEEDVIEEEMNEEDEGEIEAENEDPDRFIGDLEEGEEGDIGDIEENGMAIEEEEIEEEGENEEEGEEGEESAEAVDENEEEEEEEEEEDSSSDEDEEEEVQIFGFGAKRVCFIISFINNIHRLDINNLKKRNQTCSIFLKEFIPYSLLPLRETTKVLLTYCCNMDLT